MQIPKTTECELFENITIGGKNSFFLMAGPCVIENEALLFTVADSLAALKKKIDIGIVFKSSFDKANRSSFNSFRGPGIKEGLKLLQEIKTKYGFPLVTDIHHPEEAEIAAKVVDMLQIPAFLCRQTDLVSAAAQTGKWVNIKKGQFVAPLDTLQIVDKFRKSGSDKILICERGYTFGYNNLVVDMRGIELMRKEGIHVVIDVTHSSQLPGGGDITGGNREMAYPIGRAACAVGVDGIFLEVHPDPVKAKSDSTTQLPLADLEEMVTLFYNIDRLVKN